MSTLVTGYLERSMDKVLMSSMILLWGYFRKFYYKYNGIWHENRLVRGKWMFSNGTTYEGLFENNKPSGDGIWKFANGNQV